MIIKTRHTQRGFSLFEMLLTVGVAATFFVFLFNIGQTIARNQAVNAAASYVQDIEKAVAVLISDPERFGLLYNNIASAGGVAQISVDDLVCQSPPCVYTGVLSAISVTPTLNSSFPLTGPFRQTYNVVFRIPTPVLPSTKIIESFVVSQTKLDDSLLTRIAGAIGGTGGALRDSASVSGSTIRGAYGGWTVPANNLLSTAWYTNIAAQSPPTLQNGGYVVAYNYNDLSRIAKDYLYRTSSAGNPELNTMYTDLSLGSYNVLGANIVSGTGTLNADEVIVEGVTTLSNAPTITGSLQSDGPLTVGNIGAVGGGAVEMSAANSNVIVSGTTTTERAVINNIFTTSSHNATGITTENTFVNGGDFIATNTSGINASASAGGLVVSGNTNVGGQIQSSNITTDTLRANNGEAAAIFVQTDGNVSQSSGSTTTDQFGGVERTRSSTSNWPCGNGC